MSFGIPFRLTKIPRFAIGRAGSSLIEPSRIKYSLVKLPQLVTNLQIMNPPTPKLIHSKFLATYTIIEILSGLLGGGVAS